MEGERGDVPRALSVDDVERLLAPWLKGRRVLDVELLHGGLLNRNFCLRLAAAPETCVLRLYDRFPEACGREIAALHLMRGSVPVPEVLYVEADGALPFAVLSYVGGMSLAALRDLGDTDAISESAYDAGRILARLAAYRFAKPGRLTATLDVETSFMRAGTPLTNAGLIDQLLESPVAQQRLDRNVRERVRWFAYANEPRVAEVAAQPSLVHGDFNARNIFVHRTSGGWCVSAVLDWEFALAASPFVDIGNFLRYHRPLRRRYEPYFSRGLSDAGMDLPTDWLLLARLMDLPACLELLGRSDLPERVVPEIAGLIGATLDGTST